MRILLIGNADSVHIYNYVKYVLLPMGSTVVIFTLKQPKVFADYYLENSIEVKIASSVKGGFARIPKFNGILRIMQIKLLGKFDFCHIHYYSFPMTLAVNLVGGIIQKTIVSFWGSDLLKKKTATKLEKLFMNNFKTITLSTHAMFDRFHEIFGYKYDSKIINVKFGIPTFSDIQSLEEREDSFQAKRKLSLPDNKLIVVCGYNGNETQQHIKALEAISKCKDDVKHKIFLLIPMAYGTKDKLYIEKIKDLLDSNKLDGLVLDQFFIGEENARLRLATDIFINVQQTDAFSASMQEHMFAGAVVINGGWLSYPDLDDNGAFYYKIDVIADLGKVLTDVLDQIPVVKEKCKVNRKIIWKLSSWENVTPIWRSLYPDGDGMN